MLKDRDSIPFSGQRCFASEAASEIGRVIQETVENQPKAVIAICEEQGMGGYDDSGFPDTKAVSRVEVAVKARGRAIVALETARQLGRDLPLDDLTDISLQNATYAEVPQIVYNCIAGKKQT